MGSLFNRRMFLTGAGGFTLAIPFLPSLAPKAARAQLGGGPKRFFAFGTNHGGFRGSRMAPSGSPDEVRSYGGQEIRRHQLVRTVDGDNASISPLLRGAASRLTPGLAGKLNLLRGLFTPIHLGHNNGGMLGNYAAIYPEDEAHRVPLWKPTIDQVLAYSPTFYRDMSTNLQRSLVVGSQLSYGPVNPSNPAAGVQKIAGEWDSLTLFDRIYEAPPDEPEERRPEIADRVLEDYQRARNRARIGAGDRRRLDDYMERIFEIQRRADVQLSCGEVERPTESSRDLDWPNDGGLSVANRFYQLINDVFVVATLCDSCRVGTVRLGDTSGFADFSGNWHQDVVHRTHYVDPPGSGPGDPQEICERSYQNFFDGVFLDLASKLDQAKDADGSSILDNS
ncbi:MAG: DUF1552 domain-containing protein, partial [Myxococcota bacterium]